MNMVNMKGAAMRQITITADKKYLLIPVGNVKGWTIPAESIQYLSIYQNGSLVEEYEVCLDASPRCWSCLYLERYAGESARQLWPDPAAFKKMGVELTGESILSRDARFVRHDPLRLAAAFRDAFEGALGDVTDERQT